ncbi:MAG: hypothetical protein WBD00_02390 [Candidatus Omnitrophota bacterium]
MTINAILEKRLSVIIVCVFVFACVMAGQVAEAQKKEKWVKSKTGLSSLIQLGKDRGAMEKEFSIETKAYNSLKKAIDRGELKEGMTAKDVSRKFGAPVIEFPGNKGDTAEWVYKPGTENFLDGTDKISLIFDDSGNLMEWKSVKKKEKPTEEKK